VQAAFSKISKHLFIISFCGLALFIPFSISGANISIVLGLLAAIIGAVADPDTRERYQRIKNDPMLFASILLVLSALPAVFLSENIARALRDWKSYWLLLVYFLVAYNVTGLTLGRGLFWILFTSMSISCLVAIVQYSGGLDFLFLRIAGDSYRPSSTLYPMTFAGILYQVIAVNFAMFLKERTPVRLLLLLGGAVLVQTISMLFSLTRGAWLALVGGVLSVIVLLRRKRVLIAGVVFIALAVGYASQNETLRMRAATVIRSGGAPWEANISNRLILWDISWEVFKKHPVLGVGMGDYTLVADELLRGRKVLTTVDSHNIYLQILATRGIVGFLPFVYFWFVLLRMLFRTKRQLRDGDRFGYHFAAGTIAAAVALLIGALTENNIDDSEVFTAFLFLIGVARSYAFLSQGSNKPA
jgi:O-antigen ligase